MFNRKRSGGLTYIAQGTKLTGESEFSAEALVSGEVYGDIQSTSNITIEQDGLIDGVLNCQELRVSGTFRGKLNCNKLNITSTGVVDGEVACQSMEIFEGGQFIGMRVRDEIAFLPASSVDKQEAVKPAQIEDAQLSTS
ncbi:polymer-forming cytoskeletal protein [Shewanella gelidimarina]|uniref:bactofilin family protein n=1 Tax=Shewanella gelidimarina TaxID=56813 RepID=UPI00200C6AAE|nr:polymer-forming cytoskeletal protein [Shewanella gelidimarina]MCL1057924.1 polymer-forming cytoskeletal protein [Shewanella gelidimarina]